MSAPRHSIIGISFDGLAISGIVNEFLNVADAMRGDDLRVLFDVGLDITMGRTSDLGGLFLPPWAQPVRCLGSDLPQGYCAELVEEAVRGVIAGASVAAARVYDTVCSDLAGALVATFQRERLRYLVVENGTLPDNPLMTEALYLAIAEYGAQQGLGKYVLWRDHDLMWSTEPHFYGAYPYPGVRKPTANAHILFAVITGWMRKRMRAWAPATTYHVIPNRFVMPARARTAGQPLRAAYGVPANAYLIARCTRVVPQKSIERDLRLLREIQRRLAASGDLRPAFLFVTGPIGEDPVEHDRLRTLARTLGIDGQVIWGDGLLPFNTFTDDSGAALGRFSVRDLLAEADLSSFLT